MPIQIYPDRRVCDSVRNLYLDDPLLHRDGPLVYGNFLASLDGRIAVVSGGLAQLPPRLTSDNDLRLFLELEAQADCVVTHGGYLRALAEGRLGDILRIEDPQLREWRQAHGLAAQPLIAVCSATLDFPLPGHLDLQRVRIITGARHDRKRRKQWENRGCRVVETDGDRVEGKPLMEHLIGGGCKRIYLAAGPELFESCIAGRCVDYLYLTLSCQLLGAPDFVTMIPGKHALERCRLKPARLIVDDSPSLQYAQIYAAFRCDYSTPPR